MFATHLVSMKMQPLLLIITTTIIIIITNIAISTKTSIRAFPEAATSAETPPHNIDLRNIHRNRGIVTTATTTRQQERSGQRNKRHTSAIYTGHNSPAGNNDNIGYGPSILVSADAFVQTVELHKSHVIECVHEAEPTADIKWYHNKEPIETDGHHHQALGSELVFLETKEHDEGIYQCSATNKFGSATSPTFSLTVIKPNSQQQQQRPTAPVNHIKQQPTKPVSNQQQQQQPTVRFKSRYAKRNRPIEIICDAPDDEKIIWKVNDRQIELQPLQADRDNMDQDNGDHYESIQNHQYRFSQSFGKPLVDNQREYILTILHKQMAKYTQDQININITCAYQNTRDGAYEWIESDPSQFVIMNQELMDSVAPDGDILSGSAITNHASAPNKTYRVPIEINMAPPLDNLVNTSTVIPDKSQTTPGRSSLWLHDIFSSIPRQQFVFTILVPTIVIIILILLVILLLWRRSSVAHKHRAYKREQQSHHKSYHRHYQVAPPQSQYPPGYYPYPAENNMQATFNSHNKLSHHRSHDLSKPQRTQRTWSLFPSSKKHTQLINPFLGVNPRQLSIVSKDGYPSLDGVSSGLHLLPGMLHSSLSQNNFATAYSTNYIDMRSVTPQQGKQCVPYLPLQQNRMHQQLTTTDPNQSKFVNSNQMSSHLRNSNVIYIDTPSDGVISISPSSTSSLTNTISANNAFNGKNCTQSMILPGNNNYLSRGVSNNLIEPCDNKNPNCENYSSDKNNTSRSINHHYATIAEATRCLDNQADACYEDLDQHQLAVGFVSQHQNNQHNFVRQQPLPITRSEVCGPNDSFRSRISSFLTHQGNNKRNSGASSIRSSASMSKFNQANHNSSEQSQQQHPSPYAVTSIRGVTPTPPPPPMSEAMKALNEQFNLDQLIIFNNNGIDQSSNGINNIK